MPTVTFNKQDILSLLGKHLSDEELEERIAMFGTDLEEITADSITVEVFANRPDLLSEEGFARALASFLNIKPGYRKYKAHDGPFKIRISEEAKRHTPHVVGAVVKNVPVTLEILESIMQLQEKLHITHGRNRKKLSIGIYDLDTFMFPLSYTTKDKDFRFVPLGKNQEYTIGQILEEHEKGKLYAHLLDEGETQYPVWLDVRGKALALVPIINSEETKITEKTKNFFIDVTGIDKRAVEQALYILVAAFADRGGKLYKVNSFPDFKPQKMPLKLDYVNNLLGIELTKKEFKDCLAKMGHDLEINKVVIPCYRADVMHPIDLVEDIAIAHGYEKFEPEIPDLTTDSQEEPFGQFTQKIAEILIGFGLLETNTYHLTSKEAQTTDMQLDLPLLEITNSLSQEYNVLRAWIIPSMLQVLKNNKHYAYPHNIFEIGTIFKGDKEATRLAVALSHTKTNYTEARQILDALFTALHIKDYKVRAIDHGSFIPGRVACVSVQGKDVAYIGEIHPQVLENFELDMPVATFELNLTDLYELLKK